MPARVGPSRRGQTAITGSQALDTTLVCTLLCIEQAVRSFGTCGPAQLLPSCCLLSLGSRGDTATMASPSDIYVPCKAVRSNRRGRMRLELADRSPKALKRLFLGWTCRRDQSSDQIKSSYYCRQEPTLWCVSAPRCFRVPASAVKVIGFTRASRKNCCHSYYAQMWHTPKTACAS